MVKTLKKLSALSLLRFTGYCIVIYSFSYYAYKKLAYTSDMVIPVPALEDVDKMRCTEFQINIPAVVLNVKAKRKVPNNCWYKESTFKNLIIWDTTFMSNTNNGNLNILRSYRSVLDEICEYNKYVLLLEDDIVEIKENNTVLLTNFFEQLQNALSNNVSFYSFQYTKDGFYCWGAMLALYNCAYYKTKLRKDCFQSLSKPIDLCIAGKGKFNVTQIKLFKHNSTTRSIKSSAKFKEVNNVNTAILD